MNPNVLYAINFSERIASLKVLGITGDRALALAKFREREMKGRRIILVLKLDATCPNCYVGAVSCNAVCIFAFRIPDCVHTLILNQSKSIPTPLV